MTQQIQPEAMLCFDIYALQQAFGRLYKPLLDPLGLTYPQYLVMLVLWDSAPLAVGQIGKRLGLESSTLTPMIKRLEAAGLLVRKRDRDDERRVQVDLTEAGRALARDAKDVPASVAAATEMDEADIGELRRKLSQLHRALDRNC